MCSSSKCLLLAALLFNGFSAFANVPPNDDCSGATLLGVSGNLLCAAPVSGTTDGALPSGAGLCGAQNKDVWYSFVATAPAHTVALTNVKYVQNAVAADFQVEIFSGDCNTLTRLYCTDVTSLALEVNFGDLLPGSTYYIRVVNPYDVGINFAICLKTPPPPPLNDACAGAVVLNVDPAETCSATVGGSTQNASGSPVQVCAGCSWVNDDVWFAYTATQANQVITLSDIEHAAQPGVEQSLMVMVFSGACGNLIYFDRNAYLSGSGSLLVNHGVPGQTYYIRVYTLGSNPVVPVSFNICVSTAPAPPNDDCAGAILLSPQSAQDCTGDFIGSLHAATPSGTDCQGNAINDVWYQFVATSPTHRVMVWGYYDSYGFELYQGDCNNPVSLTCDNTDELASLRTDFTVGATYYLRVFSPTFDYFDFHVCIMTLPLPPANDDCSGALPVPVNADFSCDLQASGSTLGATTSGQDCAGQGSPYDVWYSFVAAGPAQRLIVTPGALVAAFGGVDQMGFEVYGGDCNSLSSLLCMPDINYSFSSISILGGVTPGETYYLRVYSAQYNFHEFSVCIQTLPSPPSNVSCAQAEVLIVSPNLTCDAQTSGTTAGIVPVPGSDGNCSGDTDISVWYSFTATNTTHIVWLENVEMVYGHPISDFAVAVYEGGDCGNLSYLDCFFTPNKYYLNNLQIGQTYFLNGVSRYVSAHTFTICLSSVPAPANDDCANAVVLSPTADPGCDNPIAGTTAGSSSASEAACFVNYGDVWYQFSATQAAHHIGLQYITDVETGYNTNLSMELLTGNCGTMTSVQCWGYTFNPWGSLLVGELTAGQTYYLRISGSYTTPLNFKICVTTPPPPPLNDACADAIELTLEVGAACAPVAGTTANATVIPSLPIVVNSQGDVWYSFVATQANHDIYLSDINNGGSFPGEAVLGLYTADCSNLTLLHDVYLYNNGNARFTNLSPGAAYKVRIVGYSSVSPITFNICVLAPPPPVNDECATALPLPVNSDLSCVDLLSVSILAATQSLPDCNGNTANDIWYQFTASVQTYRFDFNTGGINPGFWGYEILTGDCSNLTSVYCENQNPYNPLEQGGFIPGAAYYLRLYEAPNVQLDLSVCTRALPQPPNDACADAAVLIPDTDLSCDAPAPGSTVGATASEPDCFGDEIRDVWYTFTATEQSYLLELMQTKDHFGEASAWNFEVFAGDCSQLVSLYCSTAELPNPKALHQLTPGQTYYIRVHSKPLQAHDFTICLTSFPPAPANDQCGQATPILPNAGLVCDNVYPGTTLGATFDPAYTSPDVWYTFTATSNSHIFEIPGAGLILGPDQGLNAIIYRGADCNNLEELGSFGFGYPRLLKSLQPGETVYILVYPTNNSSAYTFDLCVKTLPLSPLNEACAGAIELIQNNSQQCDVVNAGTTMGAINGIGGQSCIYGDDVWYKFTATGAVYQIQLINTIGILGGEPLRFEVLQSQDCFTFSSLACQYIAEPVYLNDLTPGETYYVRVSSGLGSAHNFELCVNAVPPPPNDLCTAARTLDVDPGPYCSVIGGTTYGAGPSGGVICGTDANDVWYSFTALQSAHTIIIDYVREAITNDYTEYNLALYGGDCGNLQLLACRDQLVYGLGLTVGDLNVGSVYYIRMAGTVDNIAFGICVSSPPTPPDNDACATATVLPVYPDENCVTPVFGTTENANPTPTQPFSQNAFPVNDVWYAFTATQANHLVTLNNIAGASYSLHLETFSGICGALTGMGVYYNFYLNNRLLLTNLTPGATYYLRAYHFENQPTTFDICVTSMPAPPNDECAGATPLTVNPDLNCQTQLVASNYGATQSAPGCSGNEANDVWFQFTATGTSQRFDIGAAPGLNYSFSLTNMFGLEILEGACGATTVVLPCTEYEYGAAYTAQNLIAGNSYYLRLYAGVNDLKDFTICIRTLPEPPANDDCLQATVVQPNTGLDCDLLYTGSTLGATQSSVSCEGYNTHDMWYQFTAASDAHVIELTATTNLLGNGSLGLEAYSGSGCTDLNQIACLEYAANSPFTLSGLTTGATYFLRVFSRQHDAHEFTLCIRTLPPPPPNIDCINAETVVPSPDLNCSQAASGSTAGLKDPILIECLFGTSLWYQFTATSAAHFIEIQNIAYKYGSSTLGLELYRGDCAVLQQLNCSGSISYILAADLTVGTTYYIRVVGAENSASFFDLCVLTIPAPANEECPDAIALPVWPGACGSPVTGSILSTLPTNALSDCNFIADVWYSFEATSPSYFITIDHIRSSAYPSVEAFELFSGPCNQLTSLGCFPTAYPTLYENFVPGTTYYLRVGSSYSPAALFDICISSPQPDFAFYTVTLPDACAPDNNETVEVWIVNAGVAPIPVGAASVMLQVSGANTGTYGPIQNTSLIYNGYVEIITFTGIDLSNPGVNEITVSGSVDFDAEPANNTTVFGFTGLPLLHFFLDLDGDNYGNPAQPVTACYQEWYHSTDNTDCDDSNFSINPGATEICNGYDDNCDGLIDAADPGLSGAPAADIFCPNTVVIPNDPGACSAIFNYSVTSSDNCGFTLTQTSGLASGQAFPVGITQNSFTISGGASNQASCSFSVEVQKTADPDLVYAYTVIGLNDVLLKQNKVQSGGVGVVNANKKVRLQLGTTVTAPNTFVKAPILELTGGSQATTVYTGPVSSSLPNFQYNLGPSNNNVNIPNNSAPVILTLGSYGNVIVGINATVTFSGQSVVRIKELTVKDGARVLFAQNTELRVTKGMSIAKTTDFNPGNAWAVQCFAGENVTVDRSADISAMIYTLKDLRLEKASVTAPTIMTGLFIAKNINAQDNVHWYRAETCPADHRRDLAERSEERSEAQLKLFGSMQISPNPASEETQVLFQLETNGEATLQLLDAAGRLLQTERLAGTHGVNEFRLRLGGIPEGVYTLQVMAEGQREVGKLVVLRP